ncbi:SHOCT domain-containing protein [[Pseudomonas] boreopolis]|uniref:SHOCT domain-containing protein n=1 Tax=Xanthomonas boreopolis TaxID=86183 RepID=UPI003D487F7E
MVSTSTLLLLIALVPLLVGAALGAWFGHAMAMRKMRAREVPARLRQLEELHGAGLIDDEERAAQRQRILAAV